MHIDVHLTLSGLLKVSFNKPSILCSVDNASRYNSCKWPTWRTILFFVYVYSKSLHVSSTRVLIIRRISCINTTSGMRVWVEPKSAYHTVTYIEWRIPDVVLIQLILLMMRFGWNPILRTRRSPT